MIFREVQYPWGKSTIIYDNWDFKTVTLKKVRDYLGREEWIVESEWISSLNKGNFSYDESVEECWQSKIRNDSAEHKIIEHTSNCYEVIISDTEKQMVYRTGHLSVEQNNK